jgi:hypothetical protein
MSSLPEVFRIEYQQLPTGYSANTFLTKIPLWLLKKQT